MNLSQGLYQFWIHQKTNIEAPQLGGEMGRGEGLIVKLKLLRHEGNLIYLVLVSLPLPSTYFM